MKITVELNDRDAEEGMELMRRAIETVDRLDSIADDLEELVGMLAELKELHKED